MAISKKDLATILASMVKNDDYELDNEGQIVFYSGCFVHEDGTLHEEPEELDDEELT